MKVVVALTCSSAQLSGVQRHAINLTRCLLTRQEVTVVDLIAAPWQRDLLEASFPDRDPRLHIHFAPIGNSSLSRNLWYYNQLPRDAMQLQADVVHLAYPVPLSRRRYHCPVVVTLHDLYPYDIPENFGFPKVFFNQSVLRSCLQSADAIACVSHFTESRLRARWSGQYANKCSVIHNVVELAKRGRTSSADQDHGKALPQLQDRPFLLCVSQHRRNKNIILALKVFLRLLRAGSLPESMRLLIVGIQGPETGPILRFIRQHDLASSVTLVNGIPEEVLRWCYQNSQLLLAPSEIEGFGLPVAEAMLSGCKIVCSDIGAFREIGANHCRYVSLGPYAIESFSDAVLECLKEPLAMPMDLPQLSSSSIAENYVQLYRSLLPIRRDASHSPQPLFSLPEKRRLI